MDDLISRREATNELWSLNDQCDSIYYTKCIHDAVYALEILPSAQRWIPCSERLPEYGRYLVSCSWSIFSPMVMNYDPDDDEWFYDGCKSAGYEVPTINAWMPLPEAYGEDGDT